MKKIIFAVATYTLLFVSCTADQELTADTQTIDIEQSNVAARASTGVFDFADFDGETSHSDAGGSISNRAAFYPTTTDNTWYFDVTASGRVFKCNSAVGHRTELKEKSGKESSLSTAKDMEYIGKLESIPSDGVTVAQVHNRGSNVKRPLLRVYVENGKFYMKKTTNSPTSSSGTYDPVTVGPDYTSGTTFTLRVRFSGGSALVDIKTTSATMSTKTFTPTSSWSDVSSKYYLKAGVYTEGSNTDPKLTMFGFDK